jgi:hypothetical protein
MYATTTFTTFTIFLPTIHISYLRILSSCNTTESIHHHLQLGRGESNSIPTEIVNGVVLSEESVTDDPQGTDGGGDVHTGEGRDTSSTSVEDVVGSLELVDLATEAERHLGKRLDSVTVDSVLALPSLGSPDPDH